MKRVLSLPVSNVLKRHGDLTERLSRYKLYITLASVLEYIWPIGWISSKTMNSIMTMDLVDIANLFLPLILLWLYLKAYLIELLFSHVFLLPTLKKIVCRLSLFYSYMILDTRCVGSGL